MCTRWWAFGMGMGRRQKKLHCFTPKAEEFLKKVHDFVAKTLLFWGTVWVQMARGALFGVFCALSRSPGVRFAWADDEREYRRREGAEQNGGGIKRRAASVGGNCSWCCPQVGGKKLICSLLPRILRWRANFRGSSSRNSWLPCCSCRPCSCARRTFC